MKEFFKGFPVAWGPKTTTGFSKFGLGTVGGIILILTIMVLMFKVAVWGDGTKVATWTGYTHVQETWLCPSVVSTRRFDREYTQAQRLWSKAGHSPDLLPDYVHVDAEQCRGIPPRGVLRIRDCNDMVESRTCPSGKAGLNVVYNQHGSIDLFISDRRKDCILAHELGHAPLGFSHSTKATNLMYEGMIFVDEFGQPEIEACGWSMVGLTAEDIQ